MNEFEILNYLSNDDDENSFILLLNIKKTSPNAIHPDIETFLINKISETKFTLENVTDINEEMIIDLLNSTQVENLIQELFIKDPEVCDIFRIRKIFIVQNTYSNLTLGSFPDGYQDYITILDSNPFRTLFCTESFNSDHFYRFQLLNSENGVIEYYQKLDDKKFKFNKKIMFSIHENNCFEKIIVGLEILPGDIYYTFDDGTDVQKLVRLFDGDYRLNCITINKEKYCYFWHLLGDNGYEFSFDGINQYYSLNLHPTRFNFKKPRRFDFYQHHNDVMAIDLGTTRSTLSISRHTGIHTIPTDDNDAGDLHMPSCIAFCQDPPLVGDVALRRIRTHRDYVLFDTKYFTNEIKINNTNINMRYYPFAVVVDNNYQTSFIVKTTKGYRCFTSTDINEILLRKIKIRASEYQNKLNYGKPVTKAVITVPSTNYFNPAVIRSITDAANRVGIEIVDIIEEGVADLLYYMSRDDYKPMNDAKVELIDIGGGTGYADEFDFRNDIFYKKCTNNAPYCGIDTDRAIMDRIRAETLNRFGTDLMATDRARSRLYFVAIRAKEALSNEAIFRIPMDDLIPDYENEEIILDRTEVNKIPLLIYFLARAFYHPETVNRVYLAGGMCRAAIFLERVIDVFPGAELFFDRDRVFKITSQGAIVRALQVLNGEDESFINRVMKSNSNYVDLDLD